ncbi:hypothetical protein BDR26DRAFT_921663, partial [Obelidium mucronatum]
MFSLFQEESVETPEGGNMAQMSHNAFQSDLYNPVGNQTVGNETDQVFFDWQGSLCDEDGHPYSSIGSQGNSMVVDDAFLASLNEGFGNYFAQTGMSENAFEMESALEQMNPQFMRVPENADSARLNAATDNHLMISMADVLPQGKAGLKKAKSAQVAKPREKKVIKEKGGITKSSKKPTASKNVSLPNNYMSLLASAADPGPTVVPSLAIPHETSAIPTPTNCAQTPINTDSDALDMIKCESSESLQFDFGDEHPCSNAAQQLDDGGELELPAPIDVQQAVFDDFANPSDCVSDINDTKH